MYTLKSWDLCCCFDATSIAPGICSIHERRPHEHKMFVGETAWHSDIQDIASGNHSRIFFSEYYESQPIG